jgi:hypothetical protein
MQNIGGQTYRRVGRLEGQQGEVRYLGERFENGRTDVHESGSRSCPMEGFIIINVERLGPATTVLLSYLHSLKH